MPILMYRPSLKVEANLILNEKEIEILSHLCSYDLATSIHKHITRAYKDQYRTLFVSLRQTLNNVKECIKEDKKKLFGDTR